MGVCDLTVKDNIFFLALHADDSGYNNYLTLPSMEDLMQKLQEICQRARLSSKGLVTIFRGGPFCNGVDYDEPSSPAVIPELVHCMAAVVRKLFEMPFPTAAAVTGDVNTSLALALVLAHDDIMMLSEARFEMPEVSEGHDNVVPFLGALLRDKAPYPEMRSSLVLRSQAMKGSDMSYWYVGSSYGDQEEVVKTAIGVITSDIGKVRDGEAYVTTRKSFFPESWKAVTDFVSSDNSQRLHGRGLAVQRERSKDNEIIKHK